jgi:DNA-binding NarL/FixJ family response regulator
MSHVNVLVVEDFAPFRDLVCRELKQRPDFRVATASDGLAAVETAAQLRPDLILLDVGLPALNGLAAARRIQSVSPESRIVFLTGESELDLVDEALRLGSQGYIDKTRARYVLPAIEAMLEGRPAVASGVSADGGRQRAPHGHQAQFHADESRMLDAAERFLESALCRNDAAIVVATQSHLRQLFERLKANGGKVEQAIEKGSFVQFDADELSSALVSTGVARVQPILAHAIESAASATMRPDARVAVFGEIAAMLHASGHVDTAMALEALGAELVDTMPVDLTCAYPLLPLGQGGGFKSVCAHHGAVVVR